MRTSIFLDQLVHHGVTHFVAVPCSYLAALINEVIRRADTHYIIASSEGEAVAIAAGLWLGGIKAAVLCQNSGLGNMVNPLTSLIEPFGIPLLMLVSWRGQPGTRDEPQHQMMGRITPALLDLLDIAWARLPAHASDHGAAVDQALAYMRTREKSFAIVVSADSFAAAPPAAVTAPSVTPLSKAAALAVLLAYLPDTAVVVATTGMIGRELFALGERPGHFYCVGSMGYANALAHGVAMSSAERVYIVDGDGAALMHLGNLTSIGATRLPNLTHLIIDNASHDSTGGQPTVSCSCDFVALALAAGYASAIAVRTAAELAAALRDDAAAKPRLLHVPVQRGSTAGLGRPTVRPYLVARRVRRVLRAKAAR